jgi:hypothetical protein
VERTAGSERDLVVAGDGSGESTTGPGSGVPAGQSDDATPAADTLEVIRTETDAPAPADAEAPTPGDTGDTGDDTTSRPDPGPEPAPPTPPAPRPPLARRLTWRPPAWRLPAGLPAGAARLRPGRRVVTVVLVAVLAAAALTGLDAWLRHRRAVDLATVTTAYADADCGTALAAWRDAAQDPALPGRRTPPGAAAERAAAHCQALREADLLRAGGQPERAFAGYLKLRAAAPDSPLTRSVIGPRLIAVLDGGSVTARPGLCRDLAGAVEGRLLAADDAVPPVLAACGERLAKNTSEDDRAAAFVLVSTVRRDYPEAADAPRAATVEAALRLSLARRAPHTATSPFLAAPAASGPASVRFVNHSPWPVTLTVRGPGGGRVVSLPACPGCGPYVKDISFAQCLGKGPSTALTLPPGRFEMALQYSRAGPDPSHGYWDLRPGKYQECYFFTR